MTENNPTLERLEDQLKYYSKSSKNNKHWFTRLKAVEIVAAALIPLLAIASLPPFFSAILGLIIVILEGLQGLNQYQSNWITYRSTAEELKHEKYLWLAKAGPYMNAANPDTLLAERIESLISRENAKWVSTQEQGPKKEPV